MTYFLAAFVSAFLIATLLVRSSRRHEHLSGDHQSGRPQKFHARSSPRVGGLGIVLAIGLAIVAVPASGQTNPDMMMALGACGLVVFAAGLLEDFTKNVTPWQRLMAAALAAALASWTVDATIARSGIPVLDVLLTIAGVPLVVTVFTVSGVSNAFNIIDGFNGLASMCAAIMLVALALVANAVGDATIMVCALTGLGSVLGFFIWNYPMGKLFLGDGGAYFLGFWVAELGVLLIQRNPTVSPMFPLLLCAYPIFETVFSMYRRRILRGRPVGQPDASHLHSLIYRRLMRWAVGKNDAANMLRRNSMTSPYLWALCSLSAIPAVCWWNDTELLAWCIGGFCLVYLALYRAIVRFHTPRLLVRTSDHWAARVVPQEQAG